MSITVPDPDNWSIGALYSHLSERMEANQIRCIEMVNGLDRLTEAKFITHRTLMDSQDEKTRLALDASEKAIVKAEISTQKSIDQTAADVKARFASVNEFRAQLADQQATFITRAESEARLAGLLGKIEDAVDLHRRDMVAVREMADRLNKVSDDRLKILETASANFQGRLWALGTVLALVVIVVNVGIRFVE